MIEPFWPATSHQYSVAFICHCVWQLAAHALKVSLASHPALACPTNCQCLVHKRLAWQVASCLCSNITSDLGCLGLLYLTQGSKTRKNCLALQHLTLACHTRHAGVCPGRNKGAPYSLLHERLSAWGMHWAFFPLTGCSSCY